MWNTMLPSAINSRTKSSIIMKKCNKIHRTITKSITKRTLISKSKVIPLSLCSSRSIILPSSSSFPTDSVSIPIKRRSSIKSTKSKGTPLKELPLPAEYLRSMCSSNYDTSTHQRNDIPYNILTGEINISSNTKCPDYYQYNSIWIEEDSSNKMLVIQWKDGCESKFEYEWIQSIAREWGQQQKQQQKQEELKVAPDKSSLSSKQKAMYYPYFISKSSNNEAERIPWNNLSSSYVRDNLSMPYSSIINNNSDESHDQNTNKVLRHLYQYGIVLITDTPIDDKGQGIAAFASRISGGAIQNNPMSNYCKYYTARMMHQLQKQEEHPLIMLQHGTDGPMRTLYGTIWTTQSNVQMDQFSASVSDSAYSTLALPLHTDMTYLHSPPGLQLFCMIQPASPSNNDSVGNGESVYGDGYAMSNYLKIHHPKIYHTLSTIPRRYRCIDEQNGWFLETFQPLLHVSNLQNFVSLRHNDLDRLPDLLVNHADSLDYKQLEEMHCVWDEIVNDDAFRFVIDLQPGEMMVIANQRCMHGRYSFQLSQVPRTIRGCYVSQEELNSRFRWQGYRVDL